MCGRRMNRTQAMLAVAATLTGSLAACDTLDDALTSHSRPVAEVAGYELSVEELGRLMAASEIPDTALSGHWAAQLGTLWADYVALAVLYENQDTTAALDYGRLLEDQRHFAALAVERYRDSVVLRGLEPTEEEVRTYFDTRQPFTRIDVRRIVVEAEPSEDAAARERAFRRAEEIRDQLMGGADFLEVARSRSDEPAEARGQVLAYLGHDAFPPAVDSVVFRLRPGEVSPVLPTAGGMMIYRIESRHVPEFEPAQEQVRERMVGERQARRSREALDSLVGNARRAVLEGAVATARRVAAAPDMAADQVPEGVELVTWGNGELTVGEIRRLFQVRADIQETLASASDDDLHTYLMELARDEILIQAALSEGAGPTDAERQQLARAMSYQLARVASRMGLSHALVTHPRYDLGAEGVHFLEGAVRRAQALPWLGVFRQTLDLEIRIRVDEKGAGTAARMARELRQEGVGGPPVGDAEAKDATPGEEPTAEDDTTTGGHQGGSG